MNQLQIYGYRLRGELISSWDMQNVSAVLKQRVIHLLYLQECCRWAQEAVCHL